MHHHGNYTLLIEIPIACVAAEGGWEGIWGRGGRLGLKYIILVKILRFETIVAKTKDHRDALKSDRVFQSSNQ